MTIAAEAPESLTDCVFCRIVSGEIPAPHLVDNELVVAFRDADPKAPVHVLVVPRRHLAHFGELGAGDGELLVALTSAAQQVARDERIADGGYRLVFNVGEDAGNTVPHLHLHVLGGRHLGWPPG
ncbi:MAG: histidine triad protein [Acidimicrobiaceae bacterium]|nr:histidine triad protein [Acidimicrobiaceae bacterium]